MTMNAAMKSLDVLFVTNMVSSFPSRVSRRKSPSCRPCGCDAPGLGHVLELGRYNRELVVIDALGRPSRDVVFQLIGVCSRVGSHGSDVIGGGPPVLRNVGAVLGD